MAAKRLEVISVQRAVESATGDSIINVAFGVLHEIDDDLRRYLPQQPGGMPPKKVGLNTLVLFFKFKDSAPYKVGTRWDLTVKPNGELSLKEVK